MVEEVLRNRYLHHRRTGRRHGRTSDAHVARSASSFERAFCLILFLFLLSFTDVSLATHKSRW